MNDPGPTLFAAAVLFVLALFALTRTTWRPAAPVRVTRRRAWGQTLAAAARMYRMRWRLFTGIALVFLPIAAANVAVQELALGTSSLVGIRNEGESGGLLASLAVAVLTMFTLAGLGLVQAASARALTEIDAGRETTPLGSYRRALERFPQLLGAVAVAVVILALLGLTVVLVPLAVWLAGRWALAAQAIELEGASALGALRRSSELVRGRWFKAASLIVLGAGAALVLGPVVGTLLIFATDAPFALLNIVAGIVYVLAIPLVALTTTYVYFDAIVRERLDPSARVEQLPSELPTSGS